jgi:hypothetical protein
VGAVSRANVVTPVDEFDGWKREGARRRQELLSFREGACERLAEAQSELNAIDAALAELERLLGGEEALVGLARSYRQLVSLLMEASEQFADSHPLQARIQEALKLGAVAP